MQAACRESPVLPTLADQAGLPPTLWWPARDLPHSNSLRLLERGVPLSRDLPDHAATSCAIARAATIERYTVDIPAWIQGNTAVGY